MLLLIDAATNIPLAVKVGKIQEQESHWIRALVTQAQAHLARDARRHKVVVDQGLGWHRPLVAGPAVSHLCRADKNEHGRDRGCPAQATAGEEMTVGRRVHTVRHGQGSPAGDRTVGDGRPWGSRG